MEMEQNWLKEYKTAAYVDLGIRYNGGIWEIHTGLRKTP